MCCYYHFQDRSRKSGICEPITTRHSQRSLVGSVTLDIFQDYAMESGATRNFEANRMWQLMEKREIEAVAEEERTNPMVALENRTAKSNQQMIMQENLEELYELAEKIGEIF